MRHTTEKWLERLLGASIALFVLGAVLSIIGHAANRRDCHLKGGAFIEDECVKLERIP